MDTDSVKESHQPQSKSFSRKIWALLPWLVVCLLLGAIFLLSIQLSAKKKLLEAEKANAERSAISLINVVVQTIVPTRMEDRINLPAITEAWQDLLVKAEVDGKIISLTVREGDKVTKGQAIALIDRSDYQNAYNSIKARQILAQDNFSRLEKLKKKAAVSEAIFDEAQALLSELNSALADAELKLERCTITAPIAGIINSLPATEGALLAYADPVAQIVDIDRIKVNVAIPESDVTAVRKLQESSVTFAALEDRKLLAEKYFLASQPTSASMTYQLQLLLNNDDHSVLPGMFGRANIVKASREKAIGVPLYAILHQNNSQFVYVIEDNIARKKEIQTGFMEGWNMEITSGLNFGDQVAVVGHRSLEDGQPVQIIKTVTSIGEVVN